MGKQLEKEFINDIMDKIELEIEPTDIAKLLYDIYDVPSRICEQVKDMVQRLESIDNANPSEALKSLKSLDIQVKFMGILDIPSWEKYLPNIKQTLLRTQEQEKENVEYKEVLKLVFDRKVDIYHLSKSKTAEDYNSIWDYSTYCLTDEEFDLLKRWQNGKRI